MARVSCTACGDRRFVVVNVRERQSAQARPCSCTPVCPDCQGTGFVRTTCQSTFSEKVGPKQYEVVAQCPCTERLRRVRLFNAANVPGALAHATLDNWNAYDIEERRGLAYARQFAFNFKRGDGAENRGFAISGPVATGKTHLLVATVAHLTIERGVSARYIEISNLFNTIRRGFSQNKSGAEIVEPLVDVDVLAIDELGKGRGSAFELDTLDELISRRYNAVKSTLIATNLSLKPPEEDRSDYGRVASGHRSGAQAMKQLAEEMESDRQRPHEQLLYKSVGARIYSRMCEMCEFIRLPLDSGDRRRIKAEERAFRVGPPTGRTG